MDVYLSRASVEQKDTLYRLLQYSLFEESATDFNEMNDEGIFEYKWFENYFTEDNREGFFIREKKTNKLLGFVMLNEHVEKFDKGHSIAEFMIIPKYRKLGIGRKVAFECFDMYKGNWEVSPSYGNENAYLFWKKVIEEYSGNTNEYRDGIFLFRS